MKRSALAGLVIGWLLGGGTVQAALTDYWNFSNSNYSGSSFPDSIGGYNATPTNPLITFGPGANGAAIAAVQVSNSSGNGFTTTLQTFGAGTAGSPFSFETMFEYQGAGSKWGYITPRGGGGYPSPVCLLYDTSQTLLTRWRGLTKWRGRTWRLSDLRSVEVYERGGDEMTDSGFLSLSGRGGGISSDLPAGTRLRVHPITPAPC